MLSSAVKFPGMILDAFRCSGILQRFQEALGFSDSLESCGFPLHASF